MTRASDLQTALARVIGQIRAGALQDPLGRDPFRNLAVADALALLEGLDTPEALYRYPLPSTTELTPVASVAG